MSEGPTTAQGLTQIAVGGATALVVFGLPIGLFVRATENEAGLGGGPSASSASSPSSSAVSSSC